jgi:hypothetical protein
METRGVPWFVVVYEARDTPGPRPIAGRHPPVNHPSEPIGILAATLGAAC